MCRKNSIRCLIKLNFIHFYPLSFLIKWTSYIYETSRSDIACRLYITEKIVLLLSDKEGFIELNPVGE